MSKFDYTKPITAESFPYTYYGGAHPGHSAKHSLWDRGDPAEPHPDGKAWPKCCRKTETGDSCNCAFMDNRLEDINDTQPPFFCGHRTTEDGYIRVCAGWDAKYGNKAHGGE